MFVLTLLSQVCAGLLHLHSLGILHRDLRAANILIDAIDPLKIRVADFGVSHIVSARGVGPGAAMLTAAGAPATPSSSTGMSTVLKGGAALGPLQVCACALCQSSYRTRCHTLQCVWPGATRPDGPLSSV